MRNAPPTPAIASAQDNETVLSADARYCRNLVQHYANLHQGESLPPRLERNGYCESDP